MRRLIGSALLVLLSLSLLTAPAVGAAVTAAAGAEVTPAEWQWIVAAQEREAQGDIEGAMTYWAKLVDSLQTHNYDACGNYAQKLGRALDQQGRYAEAVLAFETEFFCWGQFPDRAEWTLWDERRAQQIQPTIRGFVARSTVGVHPGPLAKHEPAFGTLLGGTIDKDPAINAEPGRVAQAYGKPYAQVLVYARWGEALPVVATRNAKAAGAALQVGWEPSQGLDAVKDDSYVRSFARALKAYGHPVFLRWGAEMNGAWTPWHGDPALYRAKFALIATIMAQEAPNVAMVWAPNYVGDQPYTDYYPGDRWVDWVGINLYHDPYFQGNPASRQMDADIFYQGKRSNPLDKVKEIYATFAPHKPIMLAETGFGWATRSPYQVEVDWAAGALDRFYSYMPLLYPRIKAVAYFNVDLIANPGIESKSHYLLSGHPAMAAAYRAATASDWYLSTPQGGAPAYWHPVDQASLSGRTKVAAYVNLGGGVSRVDYLLNGRTVATATRLPWAAELDLSGLTGINTLTIRAYDTQGNLGAEQERTFDASAIRVELNGRLLDFDQPPVNLQGRVLVPARAILEALGAEISWEQSTWTVIAQRGGSTLRLQIDNPVPTRDGVALNALDVPAQIIGARTMVPARFVAENYNMDVSWDHPNQMVIIKLKE